MPIFTVDFQPSKHSGLLRYDELEYAFVFDGTDLPVSCGTLLVNSLQIGIGDSGETISPEGYFLLVKKTPVLQ